MIEELEGRVKVVNDRCRKEKKSEINKIRERGGKPCNMIWFYSSERGRVHIQDTWQEKSNPINILKNSRDLLEKRT